MTPEREPGDEDDAELARQYAAAHPPEEPPPAEEEKSLETRRPAEPPAQQLKGAAGDLEVMWNKALPVIRRMVPKHITPDRLFAIAVTARSRNPMLLKCTTLSILRGVMIGAQLGLDVSGVGGMAYLVPYYNSELKVMEAQFQAGYRGLIDLAIRSGRVVGFYTKEVYEKDEFSYVDGTMQSVIHKPSPEADPGELRGVWATAVYPNGFRQTEVMSAEQVMAVARRSKTFQTGKGPWFTDTAAMWRKTVIRRLCKLLPQSAELGQAMDAEDQAERGERIPVSMEDADLIASLTEAEEAPVPAVPATRTEKLAGKLKGKK